MLDVAGFSTTTRLKPTCSMLIMAIIMYLCLCLKRITDLTHPIMYDTYNTPDIPNTPENVS